MAIQLFEWLQAQLEECDLTDTALAQGVGIGADTLNKDHLARISILFGLAHALDPHCIEVMPFAGVPEPGHQFPRQFPHDDHLTCQLVDAFARVPGESKQDALDQIRFFVHLASRRAGSAVEEKPSDSPIAYLPDPTIDPRPKKNTGLSRRALLKGVPNHE